MAENFDTSIEDFRVVYTSFHSLIPRPTYSLGTRLPPSTASYPGLHTVWVRGYLLPQPHTQAYIQSGYEATSFHSLVPRPTYSLGTRLPPSTASYPGLHTVWERGYLLPQPRTQADIQSGNEATSFHSLVPRPTYSLGTRLPPSTASYPGLHTVWERGYLLPQPHTQADIQSGNEATSFHSLVPRPTYSLGMRLPPSTASYPGLHTVWERGYLLPQPRTQAYIQSGNEATSFHSLVPRPTYSLGTRLPPSTASYPGLHTVWVRGYLLPQPRTQAYIQSGNEATSFHSLIPRPTYSLGTRLPPSTASYPGLHTVWVRGYLLPQPHTQAYIQSGNEATSFHSLIPMPTYSLGTRLPPSTASYPGLHTVWVRGYLLPQPHTQAYIQSGNEATSFHSLIPRPTYSLGTRLPPSTASYPGLHTVWVRGYLLPQPHTQADIQSGNEATSFHSLIPRPTYSLGTRLPPSTASYPGLHTVWVRGYLLPQPHTQADIQSGNEATSFHSLIPRPTYSLGTRLPPSTASYPGLHTVWERGYILPQPRTQAYIQSGNESTSFHSLIPRPTYSLGTRLPPSTASYPGLHTVWERGYLLPQPRTQAYIQSGNEATSFHSLVPRPTYSLGTRLPPSTASYPGRHTVWVRGYLLPQPRTQAYIQSGYEATSFHSLVPRPTYSLGTRLPPSTASYPGLHTVWERGYLLPQPHTQAYIQSGYEATSFHSLIPRPTYSLGTRLPPSTASYPGLHTVWERGYLLPQPRTQAYIQSGYEATSFHSLIPRPTYSLGTRLPPSTASYPGRHTVWERGYLLPQPRTQAYIQSGYEATSFHSLIPRPTYSLGTRLPPSTASYPGLHTVWERGYLLPQPHTQADIQSGNEATSFHSLIPRPTYSLGTRLPPSTASYPGLHTVWERGYLLPQPHTQAYIQSGYEATSFHSLVPRPTYSLGTRLPPSTASYPGRHTVWERG